MSNNIPEIRFDGFDGEWEQRKLGEVVEFYNGDRSARYPNDSDMVSEGIPFINAGDLVSGRVKLNTANKITLEKYNELSGAKIKRGDIIYCLRGTLGKNAFVDNFNVGTVASSLVDIRPKKIVGKYLFQVLNSDIEYRQRTVNDEGAAQPNLSAKNLSQFDIPVPNECEQEKIALYFDNLDTLITLHQQKYDKLIVTKKSMLDKMFPKKGCKVPEIRFDGFSEPWEKYKVSGVTDRYDNLRVPVAANLRIKGTIPYYGANGIQDYVDGYTHDGEYILVAEDGANDLKNYPVNYVNGRIWVNNHAHVLQAKVDLADNRFMGYAISKADIESVLVGGGRAKLNADVLMNISLLIPRKDEQIKIASFISSLDRLIILQHQELEKLKNIKKSMLGKMFV